MFNLAIINRPITGQGEIEANIRNERGSYTFHNVNQRQRPQLFFDLYLPDLPNTAIAPIKYDMLNNIPSTSVYFSLCLNEEHSLIGRRAWDKYISAILNFSYDSIMSHLLDRYRYLEHHTTGLVYQMKIILMNQNVNWTSHVPPVLKAYISDSIDPDTICLGKDILKIGNIIIDHEKTCFFPK